jgi:hypothetical protein
METVGLKYCLNDFAGYPGGLHTAVEREGFCLYMSRNLNEIRQVSRVLFSVGLFAAHNISHEMGLVPHISLLKIGNIIY